MRLSRHVRTAVCDFLTEYPLIHDPNARRALAVGAAVERQFTDLVEFDGSAQDFCQQLLRADELYNRPPGASDPLDAILGAVAGHMGLEARARAEALRAELVRARNLPREARTIERFLDLLGLGSSRPEQPDPYQAIDDVFVTPRQYGNIRAVLDAHHAVFVLGDPHVGKTFCAVHLLWDLFRERGLEPSWVTSSAVAKALEGRAGTIRGALQDLFRPGTAVYLEDPFGRTVPADLHEFVANLREFLGWMADIDIRLVITSRTAIFESAIRDGFAPYTVSLTQELDLDTAYNPDDLAEIVRRYATAYGAAWYSPRSRRAVNEIVERLPTPHAIELFVRNTRSMVRAHDALSRLGQFADIAAEFARQIERLPTWEQGFLLVIAFFGDAAVDPDLVRALFDDALASGDLGPAGLASWDRAAKDLESSYLTAHENVAARVLALRHPSIEDGLDLCVRPGSDLLEVARRLMVRGFGSPDTTLNLVALRFFVRYSTYFWDSPRELDLFERLLASDDVQIREVARQFLIQEFEHLPEDRVDEVVSIAEETWSERMLLRLLIGATLPEDAATRLVTRLAGTWDTWVRYRVARNLSSLSATDEAKHSAGRLLLADSRQSVRRAAAGSIVANAIEGAELDLDGLRFVLAQTDRSRDRVLWAELRAALLGANVSHGLAEGDPLLALMSAESGLGGNGGKRS